MNDTLLDDRFNEKKLDNNQDIAAANKLRLAINENTKSIRTGRNAVLFAIGLLLVGTVIETMQMPELMLDSIIGFVIFTGIYGLGIFLMYKQKPMISLGICLSCYILFNALTIVADFSMLYKGPCLKQ